MPRPKRILDDRVATAVRLPRQLHERLQRTAEERDTSVNNLLTKGAELYLKHLPPLEVWQNRESEEQSAPIRPAMPT